jgi:hypothetical protein
MIHWMARVFLRKGTGAPISLNPAAGIDADWLKERLFICGCARLAARPPLIEQTHHVSRFHTPLFLQIIRKRCI